MESFLVCRSMFVVWSHWFVNASRSLWFIMLSFGVEMSAAGLKSSLVLVVSHADASIEKSRWFISPSTVKSAVCHW